MKTLLAWGLLLFGIGVTLTSTIGVYLNYSPVPFWDQWYGVVGWYIRAERDWWPAFWSRHNEHRLLFSRPIFWADMRYFGGINILSLIANLMTCGVLSIAVYRSSVFRASLTKSERMSIAGLTLAACFSWMQRENFTWGFQNQWFAVYFFALLSFQALCVGVERGNSNGWLLLAILCGAGSAFSMASGLLALPLLFLLSIAMRLPLFQQAPIAVAAAAVWIANFWTDSPGATGTIPHGNLSYAISHDPVGLAQYALSYIGAPMWFAFGSEPLAVVLGALIFAGSGFGAWLVARGGRTPLATPLLALSCMLCLTAIITAGGRLVLGINNVFQGRYATSGLLAIICLWLFYYLNSSSPAGRGRMQTLLAIFLVALLIGQLPSLSPNREALFSRLVAGEAVREGALDDAYLKQLWERTEDFRELLPAARKQGLTIFARLVPGYADLEVTARPTSTCHGSIDIIEPTATPNMMKASGWIYDFKTAAVPKTLVIADADGRVLGQGISGAARPDVAAYLHTDDKRFGWVAFYKSTSDKPQAIGDTGSGFCRVGG